MKKSIFTVALTILASSNLTAQTWMPGGLAPVAMKTQSSVKDPSNDAVKFLLADNNFADLSNERNKEKMYRIDVEIAAIKKKVLTEEAANQFFPNVLPYQEKVIIVKFDPQTTTLIESLVSGDELDLSNPIGVKELDELNSKYDAQRLFKKYKFSRSWTIEFAKSTNMFSVAKDYDNLTSTEYAQANGIGRIGGGSFINRILVSNHVPTYIINLGWGDCPAGCMENNRTYYEVTILDPIVDYSTTTDIVVVESRLDIQMHPRELNEVRVLVEKVGRVGSELKEEVRDRVFKQ